MIYLVPTNESSPFHCANPISFFWRNLIEQKLRLPPLINVFHKLTHIIVYKCVYTVVYKSVAKRQQGATRNM